MRLLSLLLLLPVPALAHVGHLEEANGHSHFVAAWALFGVIAGSLWLIRAELRARRSKPARGKDGGAGA
jgi:hypothetical protein